MLKQVQLKNIKSLADVTIDLAPLTVLVGPNGCGKSTVLDQVDRLCVASRPMPVRQYSIGSLHYLLEDVEEERRSAAGDGAMLWRAQTEDTALAVELSHGVSPSYLRVAMRAQAGDRAELLTDATGSASDVSYMQVMELLAAKFNWRSLRLRFDRDDLAAPAPVVERVDLDPSGYGLAPLLVDIRLNDSDRFERIERDLRAVVPQFERLYFRKEALPSTSRTRKGRDDAPSGYALILAFQGGARVPAKHASEGTLFALGLLTAVYAHELPNIVLIDDIDHGLHLSAQYTLIKALRGVMAARPELQILCTSHAPVLLDSFEVDEVRVMALDKDGATRVRPLAEAPGLDRLRRGLGTGELWASLGEDWVLNEG